MNQDVNSRIKDHLSAYKANVLKIEANGVWKKNGQEYSHILPENDYEKNILSSEFHQEILNEIKNIKLHPDFHHLNSSQAMCFNLFSPLFLTKNFDIVLGLIKNESEHIINHEFEHIEDVTEKTNFDLYAKTSQSRYYFEVKYSEDGFQSTTDDERHIKKYNEIYKTRLSIFNNLDQKTFFDNYQLFRNMIYCTNGYITFVFPSFRNDLKEKVVEIKEKFCTNDQKQKIFILTVEEIVNKSITLGDKKLNNHYSLFKEKYFI
ncbi:hypothetical protein FACS189444_4360 [Spirochaetia bacterium]|nr:hypothetical protein FACS189444_4360 [Spirochaetia bacterium]